MKSRHTLWDRNERHAQWHLTASPEMPKPHHSSRVPAAPPSHEKNATSDLPWPDRIGRQDEPRRDSLTRLQSHRPSTGHLLPNAASERNPPMTGVSKNN